MAVRAKQKGGSKPARLSTAPAVTPAPFQSAAVHRHALLIVALWTCAFIAYSNSFSGALVMDNRTVLQDSRIKALTPENIQLMATQEYWYNMAMTGLYRPLTTFSYLVNYTILGNGEDPSGYHWINFALHALNIALVYILGLALFGEIQAAFAMAALWSVHPLLTESVTNIVGRADLMAGFGVLGGLVCHIRAASAIGWRKAAWLTGLALVTTFAYASKESAVVVIAAMLIFDIANGLKSWRTRAPGYIAAGIPLLLYLYIRHAVLSKLPAGLIAFTDNPLYGAGFWSARLTAVKVIGKYLWLLVWPGTLSCDYSYNQIPLVGWGFRWEDMKAWIALAAVLAALWAAIWAFRRRHKAVFFCILFFFATFAPTANIFIQIGTIMAERFMYLPSIGYAGCLVAAILAGCRRLPLAWRRPGVVAAVAGAIALMFVLRTYERNKDWIKDEAFWARAIETSPNSFKTHMAYSTVINTPGVESGVDHSINEIEKSLTILRPLPDSRQSLPAYISAGIFYRQKGILAQNKFSDSAAGARQAREWYQKSLAMLVKGKAIETAMAAEAQRLSQAHSVKVSKVGSLQLDLELGRTYLALNNPGMAIEVLRSGLNRRPLPDFYFEIAAAWRALGDFRRAAVTLLEGVLVDPGNTSFTGALIETYKAIDSRSCAVKQDGPLSKLDVTCPMVHDDLCSGARNLAGYYLSLKQRPNAQDVTDTAIRRLGCPADQFR